MADDFSSRFVIQNQLGRGTFGSVYKVQCRADGKTYALKILEIVEKLPGNYDYMKEVYIMMALVHPNIITYYRAIQSSNQHGRTGILVEYCPKGDLDHFISHRNGNLFSKQRLTKWMRELASAVAFLHEKSIMHRDLKPSNIFLDKYENVKLGDFGISRVLTSTSAATIIGTPLFMAPEAQFGHYDFKADIYSLGCVFLCMATLTHVPKGPGGEFYQLPDYSVYGELVNRLILSCIRGRSSDRPKAEEVIRELAEQALFTEDHVSTLLNARPGRKNSTSDKLRVGLSLHQVHSPHVVITDEVARRVGSRSRQGVVFTNRPVVRSEEVSFEVVQVSGSGHALVSFGFTSVDPQGIRGPVPDSVRQLESLGETWIVCRYEMVQMETKFTFHYDQQGQIYSTCRGRDKYRRENQSLRPGAKVWAVFSLALQIQAVRIAEVSGSGSLKMETVVGFPGKPINEMSEGQPFQTPPATKIQNETGRKSSDYELDRVSFHKHLWRSSSAGFVSKETMERARSSSCNVLHHGYEETSAGAGTPHKRREDPTLVGYKSYGPDGEIVKHFRSGPENLPDRIGRIGYLFDDNETSSSSSSSYFTTSDIPSGEWTRSTNSELLTNDSSYDSRRQTLGPVIQSLTGLETANYPPPPPFFEDEDTSEMTLRHQPISKSKSAACVNVDSSRRESVRSLTKMFEGMARTGRK